MKLFTQQQISFVFFPHLPESVRLDTMPFAANTLSWLAAFGWNIDVFLLNTPEPSGAACDIPRNIHYKHITMLSRRSKINFAHLTVQFALFTNYKCVFSVGQIGSYIGAIISRASRCPYILLNDEFPSCWGRSIWTPLERWGARRADAIIVPSEDRQTTLREELQLDRTKRFVTIRNTPELSLPVAQMDWHRIMNIPCDKKIFLHAGSLADWAQVPELLVSVSYWPVDAVLLIHSRSPGEAARYRQELSHLDKHEKVFWSLEPLSEAMLHSLISYCSGSFALYRNLGPNVELVGTSSGKIMRSVVCGTPMITSSFKSLDFVTREGVGIQVSHPSEIPIAVDNLMRNQESYRKECLRFARCEKYLREEGRNRIVKCVENASNGIDLSSPSGRRKLRLYPCKSR
jgi:hypothetical protein